MICETLGSILRTEIEKHKTNKQKQRELGLLDPELNHSAPKNLEQA